MSKKHKVLKSVALLHLTPHTRCLEHSGAISDQPTSVTRVLTSQVKNLFIKWVQTKRSDALIL
ncbi:hypothetical protein Hanom_Chr06g00518011 [Helianthus anomalus]